MTQPSEKSFNQRVRDYAVKRGRLELLTGLIGINSLQRTSQETLKNQQAENAYVRKKLWGQESVSRPVEEDMQTVLGDLNTTTNVTNEASQWPKVFAQIALAAGLGGGAYFIADAIKNRPVESNTIIEQPATEDTDTTIKLSLPDLPE